MSKGGAGKVYFVLYLAVILELLIIIVERDEAEEHLIRKQKEAEEIVEAVMAQLNTGSGSSGVNALPQDEITILGEDALRGVAEKDRPKDERTYQIRVSTVAVKDILGDALPDDPTNKRRRIEEIIRLFNVSNLTLIDSVNQSSLVESHTLELKPEWLKNKADEISRTMGELNTITDVKEFKDGIGFLKAITPDSTDYTSSTDMATFRFSPHLTFTEGSAIADQSQFADGIKVFEYTFKQKRAGLYRIMLQSKTNNIIGVTGLDKKNNESEEDVVSIGTIQLTRRQLSKVESRLRSTLGGSIEAICDKFQTSSDYKYPQFSVDLSAALEKVNHEDIGLASKSDKIRRGELLKNITVLLHGDANQMEQNNPNFQFEINVKEPKIATPDPKIADLEMVVRVFDKLSKLELPMQVTPASGKTSITKNHGGASIPDAGGSSSSGGEKWVGRKMVIPIAGVLPPREEPYVFEVIQEGGGKRSEPVQCSVFVYPSSISNADLVKNALEVSWGDAIELVVSPSSGNTIKPNEFIMQFNLGGSSQLAPINKLTVQTSDNVIVPPGAEKVGLTVGWKDSRTGEVVELFSGSGDVGLKKPTIVTTDMRADPIQDQASGEFTVKGFSIKPPMVSESDRANIGKVEVAVSSATIKDMRTGQSYKAVVVGKPRKSSGNDYEVTLKLQGSQFPLSRGQVKGSVTVTVSATATSEGVESKPRMITKTVSISN